MNRFQLQLAAQLQKIYEPIEDDNDLEGLLDASRSFKNTQVELIQRKADSGQLTLEETFARLSDLAELILLSVTELARMNLQKIYGCPTYINNQGHVMLAELAILGMGKFGGREMHYGSDLDLVFLFSRNGETEGRKVITNQEFFVRLVQKLIAYLTVPTRQGILYKIDTQLRPSGNQGALVSTLDAYAQYHRDQAQPWEKQALLKARPVSLINPFSKKLKEQLQTLLFVNDFPSDLNQQIHRLRLRMQQEAAHESVRCWNYKIGLGGLADIEFAVQYLQLKMGKLFPFILSPNTMQSLGRMQEREIVNEEQFQIFSQAYWFYRLLEVKLETRFQFHESYLDIESERLSEIAAAMGKTSEGLIECFAFFRAHVRKVYERLLQL